jgi:competence protein ComEC
VFSVIRYQLVFPLSEVKVGQQNFVAYVATEPDVRLNGVNYIVKIEHGAWNMEQTSQKIYLKQNLYHRYNYGDVLQINCDLQKPEALPDFRYDMYLAKQGVFTVCQNSIVEKIAEGKGNFLKRNLLIIKNILAERINVLWHEPKAGFVAGLLYGYRGGLGDLQELFNKTGVSHIIAISGYNISLIATLLSTILIYLWLPRKKAFWLIVLGIILFVIFTGASASVIRAGVMGIIVLLAKQVSRLSRMINVLLLAVVIMALQNPLVLVWDAGFQLSLAATCGILFIAPLIVYKWFGINETLSAIIATLPLILYQFGRLSIVSPVVNLLILWSVPFIMFFGFLAVLTSFVFYPLGQVLAWITGFGLQYIISVVKWFGSLSFSAVDIRISWWIMVVMYGVMVYVVVKSRKYIKIKHKFN